MNEIKAELHKLLLKAIIALGSTKIWLTLIGMGLSAFMGWRTGGIEGLIIALAGSLGLPLTYVVAKAYQNTHGANAPEAINNKAPAVTPIDITQPSIEQPVISLVKDRIVAMQKLVTTDEGMWDYLKGALGNRIKTLLQHMLDLNPNLKTLDAVKEVVDTYLGKCLTIDECAAINAYLGLPEVIHANTDVDILGSFEQAAKAGRLVQYQIEGFRYMAKLWTAYDIANEAQHRVRDDSLPVDQRRLALQEFGLSKSDATRSFFYGGGCTIWNVNHYELFDGYALIGFPELTKWTEK